MSVLVANTDSLETSALETYFSNRMNELKVVSFGCGEKAWNYLHDWQSNEFNSKRQSLSAIIVEVRLCCLDGVTLLQRIRRHEDLKMIPIIVWYSYLPALEAEMFDALGVTAKIFKGFDSDSRYKCYQSIEKYLPHIIPNEAYGLAL